MNDIATRARKNASHCEVKKHALRQTQDGIVVAFVLHPDDIPATLQLAPLGTRFMLALVEIDEDETPIKRKEVPAPVRALKNYTQQAAIYCAKPAFWKFAQEHDHPEVIDDVTAADYVRTYCGVKSRRDIRPGTQAENRWLLLVSAFVTWNRAPTCGAA